MLENIIQPQTGTANLQDYREACKNFSWDDVGREFSWHESNKLNIGYEAVDRHADDPATAGRNCLVFSNGSREEKITYAEMRLLSNRFGNVLRGLGAEKGSRVALFMPSLPEMYIAMAGCAKAGAVIVPLKIMLQTGALGRHMSDARAKVLITTTEYRHLIPVGELPDLEHIIVVGDDPSELDEGDLLWKNLMQAAPEQLDICWVDRDFPLFIVYTSGRHGKPVGLLHAHDAMRGYLMTSRWVLDLQQDDILWTQALPGGHLHAVYSAFAPWLCGVTTFTSGRMERADTIYRHIERYGITVMYTAPEIYKMLTEAGQETSGKYDLNRLRHLINVGHTLESRTIYAIMRILGTPVYDTWLSEETGMITIANFRCLPIKPGFLGKPFPGIHAGVFDSNGEDVEPFTMGALALKSGRPPMACGEWNSRLRARANRSDRPWLMPGDMVFRDLDGYFFHQGHNDDAVVTGEGRLCLAEIEDTLLSHPAIADAGGVRVSAEKGSGQIKTFVCLQGHYRPSEFLKLEILAHIMKNLSCTEGIGDVEFVDELPRDKDGTILRRVLKAWDLGLPAGDMAALTESRHEGQTKKRAVA